MSITTKTVDVTAEEIKKISFDKAYPYIYVKNFSESVVFASEKENFAEYEDNVTAIPAHSTGLIYRNTTMKDINILSLLDAKVEILGAYEANLSFNYKNSNEGGGGGEPVDAYTKAQTDALLSAKESLKNKVKTMSASSTDEQYPSARAVYVALQNKVNNDEYDEEIADINSRIVVKNILTTPCRFETTSLSGITYIGNADGSVRTYGTRTGTTTNSKNPIINTEIPVELGDKFKLSVFATNVTAYGTLEFQAYKPKTDGSGVYAWDYVAPDGGSNLRIDNNNGHVFLTVTDETWQAIRIIINSNKLSTAFDVTFFPMLEKFDDGYSAYNLVRDDLTEIIDNSIVDNLISSPLSATSSTVVNGIIYTPNSDGTVTVAGRATKTGNLDITIKRPTLEVGQTYTLSNGGFSSELIYLRLLQSGGTFIGSTKYGALTFTATEETKDPQLRITVNDPNMSFNFDNVIIKPMLEKGSIAHAFQPYSLSRQSLRDDIDALISLL